MSERLQPHHPLEAFLREGTGHGDRPCNVSVGICPAWSFVNIRSRADNKALLAAVSKVLDTPLPVAPNTRSNGPCKVFWLGPDEWLLVAGDQADALQRNLHSLGEISECSVVELSDGYIGLTIEGAAAREVLACGCTVDLHPAVFNGDMCAQTAIARTAVLIAATPSGGFELIVRRTFAEYLALWLRQAGREAGIRFHVDGQIQQEQKHQSEKK